MCVVKNVFGEAWLWVFRRDIANMLSIWELKFIDRFSYTLNFTGLPFVVVNTTIVFLTLLSFSVHKMLRIVLVDRNVILRFVIRKRCDSCHIRGPWNVKVTNIICLVLWVLGTSGGVFYGAFLCWFLLVMKTGGTLFLVTYSNVFHSIFYS